MRVDFNVEGSEETILSMNTKLFPFSVGARRPCADSFTYLSPLCSPCHPCSLRASKRDDGRAGLARKQLHGRAPLPPESPLLKESFAVCHFDVLPRPTRSLRAMQQRSRRRLLAFLFPFPFPCLLPSTRHVEQRRGRWQTATAWIVRVGNCMRVSPGALRIQACALSLCCDFLCRLFGVRVSGRHFGHFQFLKVDISFELQYDTACSVFCLQ
mmetsp:Transcript_11164/g.21596  ORF Transcript_11164/g.21596 Transcript_11164/m.21596 type:complete len:212 (+) Transcript_11164:611-1246(+)